VIDAVEVQANFNLSRHYTKVPAMLAANSTGSARTVASRSEIERALRDAGFGARASHKMSDAAWRELQPGHVDDFEEAELHAFAASIAEANAELAKLRTTK
jgi:hypothetical protein